MPKTTVVMPTYNEKENLPLITEAVLTLPIEDLRLLIVDDNSPDGTGAIADQLVPKYEGRLSVLHRQQKQGLGPAYVAGFKQAISNGADYLIQMDADFSHQPKYIAPMIALANEGYDVVVGSRYARGGSVEETWPLYRKLLSWFANRVYVPAILRLPIHDATGGFRLWRRETLIGMNLDQVRSSGYVFQVELSYIATRLGYRMAEIPIYFPDRERGYSKMSARIQIEAALRVWQVMYRHRALNPQKRRTQPYRLPGAHEQQSV